jgi:hypothetical protein
MVIGLERDGLTVPGIRTPIRFSAASACSFRAAPALERDA